MLLHHGSGEIFPKEVTCVETETRFTREAQHTWPAALLAYSQCTVLQSPEGNTCIPCALRGPACEALRARSDQQAHSRPWYVLQRG